MTQRTPVSSSVDTHVDCHYRNDPRRPDCEGAAVVAYGRTPLCESCDLRRSTLGKGLVRRLLLPAGSQCDALQAVAEARLRVVSAEEALALAVAQARGRGCSWSELGRALNVTRQAAQQRYSAAPKGGDR
jgi:hypothetical protein